MGIFQFKKAAPTVYVIHFQDGKVHKQGPGLSFWYFKPTSSIVDVPIASLDVPFIFNETTSDFQQLTIQGQLTYRITEPERTAQLLDFSVNAGGGYTAEDDPIELLSSRLTNTAQTIARSMTQAMPLSEALHSHDQIVRQLLEKIRKSDSVQMLGLEILSLSVLAIRPTPEIGRALEAESRELLHRRADQAIYARRNAAVEEEQRIKESELNTEIAVENKRRQINETRMSGEIALEMERSKLVDIRIENDKKDTDSRVYALTQSLKPLEKMDYRMLMAIAAKGSDPRIAISMAFQELAQNASKIGTLNMSPDLLQTLLTKEKAKENG